MPERILVHATRPRRWWQRIDEATLLLGMIVLLLAVIIGLALQLQEQRGYVERMCDHYYAYETHLADDICGRN